MSYQGSLGMVPNPQQILLTIVDLVGADWTGPTLSSLDPNKEDGNSVQVSWGTGG